MTEWIDFSVYAAMTIVCSFGSASWAPTLALQMVADRNEEGGAEGEQDGDVRLGHR